MYHRQLKETIEKRLFSGKVIIIIGPRQVGKTTLVREILKGQDYLFLDGDDILVRTQLATANTQTLRAIVGNAKVVFIDEAQRIENIGLALKIMHDQMQPVQLIVSGSSAFELKNAMNEPLTGRKWEYLMLPISYEEYENKHGYLHALADLNNRLIYGFYPDVVNHPGDERDTLKEIVNSYLYKDILAFGNIQKPEMLEKLITALAFQVGQEVSYNELSQLIGIDKNTVSQYIRLLELSYVVYPLTTFSRNLRNEIKTNRKIYFYDNGIRNAVIQNFNPLDLRNDTGALWENFLMTERLKRNHYHRTFPNRYFWRTRQQQEVDYVEEMDGKVQGYEFKWNPKAKSRIPASFTETYQTSVQVIHKENFRDFVIGGEV